MCLEWAWTQIAPAPLVIQPAERHAPQIGLALCAIVFWLRAGGTISGTGVVTLVAMTCLLVFTVAIVAMAAGRLLSGWRWLLASPVAIAAAAWLPLFALRPIELYFYPGEAITPMIQLGYDTGDLSRTVAIAGLGCATWSIGFLAILASVRSKDVKMPTLEPLQLRRRAPWVVIGLGAMLAGALFMRQGGPPALIHSAGTLHTNQGSGFYGQLGIWMLVGTALYAFAAVLQEQNNARAKRVLLVSAPLAVALTLALGSRGFIAFGLLAAAVIYLRMRTPSARAVAATIAVAVLLAGALEFVAIVRTNAAATDLKTAVTRTFQTPVPAFRRLTSASSTTSLRCRRSCPPRSRGSTAAACSRSRLPWRRGRSGRASLNRSTTW